MLRISKNTEDISRKMLDCKQRLRYNRERALQNVLYADVLIPRFRGAKNIQHSPYLQAGRRSVAGFAEILIARML